MPTVIDSLFIELGLDSSKFDSAQKKSVEELRKFQEAYEKSRKNQIELDKKTAQGVNDLKNSLLGAALAAAGYQGANGFITNMVKGNAELGRTSQLLGLNVKELDAWGKVAETVGGNAQGFANSLQNIEGNLAKFKLGIGGADLVASLSRLPNFNVGEAVEKGTVDIYKLADSIKYLKEQRGLQSALAAGQTLGLDQGTFQLLIQGGDALRKIHDEFERLSGASNENSASAQRLQGTWAHFKQTLSAVGQTLFSNIEPALEIVLKGADYLAGGFLKLDKSVGGALSTFLAILSVGKTVSGVIDTIGASVAKLVGIAIPSGIATFFSKIFGAASLYLHADELNKGEQEQLDAIKAKYSSSGKSRPNRNNNPGNLEYGPFAIAHGAIGSDGRFAIFPDAATGIAAQQALLSTYKSQGNDTIAKIVSKYSPSKENGIANTLAYINDVARQTGIGANQKLTDEQLSSVREAMARHEGYTGAKLAIQGKESRNSSLSSSQTTIQNLNVNTPSTDPKAHAIAVKDALQRDAFINAGVSGNN